MDGIYPYTTFTCVATLHPHFHQRNSCRGGSRNHVTHVEVFFKDCDVNADGPSGPEMRKSSLGIVVEFGSGLKGLMLGHKAGAHSEVVTSDGANIGGKAGEMRHRTHIRAMGMEFGIIPVRRRVITEKNVLPCLHPHPDRLPSSSPTLLQYHTEPSSDLIDG